MPKPKSLLKWIASEQLPDVENSDDVGVRKYGTVDEDVVDLGDRRIRFVMSASTPDRDKDVISADGWELDNFRKNPVAPWAHDSRGLPVGRWEDVGPVDGKLMGTLEFAPAEVHPFAETVYQLYRHGFLKAVSVGFRPIKWSRNEERGGIDFDQQELLETSPVPIPAHPQALVAASAEGIDLEPLRKWVGDTILSWPEDNELRLPGKAWEKLGMTRPPAEVETASADKTEKAEEEAEDYPPAACRVHAKASEMGTREREEMLRDALIDTEKASGWLWVEDIFEASVVYEMRSDDEPHRLYARGYKIEGRKVRLSDDRQRVRRRVSYENVSDGESAKDVYELAQKEPVAKEEPEAADEPGEALVLAEAAADESETIMFLELADEPEHTLSVDLDELDTALQALVERKNVDDAIAAELAYQRGRVN